MLSPALWEMCPGCGLNKGFLRVVLVDPETCEPAAGGGTVPVSPTPLTANRVVLQGAGTWTAPAAAKSVTITAIAVTTGVTVTTVAGTSPMFQGETATWSIVKDADQDLSGGPIEVETGVDDIVTVNWTE
jgi:hypothetical protein